MRKAFLLAILTVTLGACSTNIVKAPAPPDSLLNCERTLEPYPEDGFTAALLAAQSAKDRKAYGDLRECYVRLRDWLGP